MLYWCGPLYFYPCCCSPCYFCCQRCTKIDEKRGKLVLFLLTSMWERVQGRIYPIFIVIFEIATVYSPLLVRVEENGDVNTTSIIVVIIWIISNILGVISLIFGFFFVGKFRLMIYLPHCFHLMVGVLAFVDSITWEKTSALTMVHIIFIAVNLWYTFHIPHALYFKNSRIENLSQSREFIDTREHYELVENSHITDESRESILSSVEENSVQNVNKIE